MIVNPVSTQYRQEIYQQRYRLVNVRTLVNGSNKIVGSVIVLVQPHYNILRKTLTLRRILQCVNGEIPVLDIGSTQDREAAALFDRIGIDSTS